MLFTSGIGLLALMSGCGTASPAGDGQVMGAGSGYHYSSVSCAAPPSLAGHTVAVTLADMGMTPMMGGSAPRGGRMMLSGVPAQVPAGRVSLVASNRGWRDHELVILPLAAGARAGQLGIGAAGKVSEGTSVGEASKSCGDGAGEGIRAGTAGWTTVTLPAGRYELLCNLPDHYASGMYQEMDVM